MCVCFQVYRESVGCKAFEETVKEGTEGNWNFGWLWGVLDVMGF